MAVTDEVTLRVVGRYQDQNIVNTFHYRITGQASNELTVLDALIDLWTTANQVAWLARHVDTYELIGIKAFNKVGPAKTPGFETIGAPGTVVGTEVVSAVCRTITLYTASANHRRRGRVMLSGGEAAMFDDVDGSVSTVEIAALDALGTLLNTDLAGGGDEFRLGIGSSGVLIFEDISDAKGRETPSIVRSRRIKQFLIG